MARLLILGALVWVADFREASAQEHACPEPRLTVEMFEERLVRLAADEARFRSVAGLVGRVLAPGPPPGCGELREDINLEAAMDALIRSVALRNDPRLDAYFFAGVREAVRAGEGRSSPVIPIDALRFAVDTTASAGAIFTLQRLADEPDVRAYLLELTRSERGPPSRPDLPAELIEVFFLYPTDRDALVRSELRSDPSRIRHPRARCIVERGPNPAYGPPVCPPDAG